MLVRDLITSIRYKVGDTKATKWDNTRVIEIINEGLLDISKKVGLSKQTKSLPIIPYQREIVIDDDNYLHLSRVRINGKPIKVITFAELDKIDNWESHTGEEVKYFVYDKQSFGVFTLYPLLEAANTNYDELDGANEGMLLDVPGIERDSVDGIITDIEDTTGFVSDLHSNDGAITDFEDLSIIARVTYVVKEPKIVSIDDEFKLPAQYLTALKYFIAGMLLFDDNRSESINKAEIFIQKYNAEIKVDELSSMLYNQSIACLTTNYRTGFGN